MALMVSIPGVHKPTEITVNGGPTTCRKRYGGRWRCDSILLELWRLRDVEGDHDGTCRFAPQKNCNLLVIITGDFHGIIHSTFMGLYTVMAFY